MGRVYEPLRQYLEGFCVDHYSPHSLRQVRHSLGTFAEFICERRIRSFAAVTSKDISDYLIWAKEKSYFGVNELGAMSTYFDWLCMNGSRSAGNPIIRKFHSSPRPKLLPRPYSLEAQGTIWSILADRGTAAIRLAAAIGHECGLRYGEVSRLRVQDFDQKAQQLFVRLPNKSGEEAWVPYSERTKRYLSVWLAVRPASKSDRLFVHEDGTGFGVDFMRQEFLRILCQSDVPHAPVLDSFSFHRFRHTMSTNLKKAGADLTTIMSVGRWGSVAAAQGYTETTDEDVQVEFHRAMAKLSSQKEDTGTTKITSLSEFMKMRKKHAGESDNDWS